MTSLSRAGKLAAVATASLLALSACAQESDPNTNGNSQATQTTDGNSGDGGGGDSGGGDGGTASGSPTEYPGAVPKGDGQFTVGTILPDTGDLEFLGPPEYAGVDTAIAEINEAGGVLGKQVKTVSQDSGDGTPNIATASAQKLVDANADVAIGAASSSVSLAFIDTLVNNDVVHFSPANTSTAFDTYADKGLYFRTAPSDVLQGAVLGNLVLEDGAKNVAILARQDSYGEALATQVENTVTSQGGTVGAKVLYNADAQTFTAEITEIEGTNPDALIVIGFEETTKIVPRLSQSGIGPQDIQIYFVDGNTSNYGTGPDGFEAGTLDGVKATYPGAELNAEFKERMLETDPKLKDFTYGPESYDAVIISALAAEQAGDDSGPAIANEIVSITRDGTQCTGFAECLELIKKGEDIDYEGASGPTDMGDTGSPSKATIGIFEYNAKNEYENTDYVTGVVE